MKLCPIYGKLCLTRADSQSTSSYSEMALSKRYKCSLCNNDHLYCILCKIMIPSFNWYSHHSASHKIPAEPHMRGYMLAVCDDGSVDHYFSNHMGDLYAIVPQLYALKLERCRTYEYSVLQNLPEYEVHELIWKNAFDNEYSCCLCENPYDSFPTKKVVRTHFKTCIGRPNVKPY